MASLILGRLFCAGHPSVGQELWQYSRTSREYSTSNRRGTQGALETCSCGLETAGSKADGPNCKSKGFESRVRRDVGSYIHGLRRSFATAQIKLEASGSPYTSDCHCSEHSQSRNTGQFDHPHRNEAEKTSFLLCHEYPALLTHCARTQSRPQLTDANTGLRSCLAIRENGRPKDSTR